jgi:hypothetical protein
MKKMKEKKKEERERDQTPHTKASVEKKIKNKKTKKFLSMLTNRDRSVFQEKGIALKWDW